MAGNNMHRVEISNAELVIPEGINYSCSGCGRCCNGITVPLTETDYERVSALDMNDLIPNYLGQDVFRIARDHESEGTAYTHAIKQNDQGHCPFLVDKLCSIHGKYGSDAKPIICQLFPYNFNKTPTGTFVTVSFRSTAVLYNQGTPLHEQTDVLEDRLNKYQALYYGKTPNWNNIKLTVNQPLEWNKYIEIEEELLEYWRDNSMSLEDRMLKGSAYLQSLLNTLPAKSDDETASPLNGLDKHLLVALHTLYWPTKAKLTRFDMSFNAMRFSYQVAFGAKTLKLPARCFSFQELNAFPWPSEDKEIEDLLYRFFYSRIFGKWYFGGGFQQLGLIIGYHHLAICLALVKMHSKASAIARGQSRVAFLDVAHAVRRLEEQLSEIEVSPNGVGIWELLMFSRKRLRRIFLAV